MNRAACQVIVMIPIHNAVGTSARKPQVSQSIVVSVSKGGRRPKVSLNATTIKYPRPVTTTGVNTTTASIVSRLRFRLSSVVVAADAGASSRSTSASDDSRSTADW